VKILILDDDEQLREALSEILNDEGYATVEFANGAEGINHLQTTDVLPDLVIVDDMMPVMDGLQFRKQQLANSAWASIPTIQTSPRNNPQTTGTEPHYYYISKPFQLDKLLDLIAFAIKKRFPGDPTTDAPPPQQPSGSPENKDKSKEKK
jgi:DNA-binding response OmpR family regulator